MNEWIGKSVCFPPSIKNNVEWPKNLNRHRVKSLSGSGHVSLPQGAGQGLKSSSVQLHQLSALSWSHGDNCFFPQLHIFWFQAMFSLLLHNNNKKNSSFCFWQNWQNWQWKTKEVFLLGKETGFALGGKGFPSSIPSWCVLTGTGEASLPTTTLAFTLIPGSWVGMNYRVI